MVGAVLFPQGCEAAFAPEPPGGPGQMCREGWGQSRGEGCGAPSSGVSRPVKEGDRGEAVGETELVQVTGPAGEEVAGLAGAA